MKNLWFIALVVIVTLIAPLCLGDDEKAGSFPLELPRESPDRPLGASMKIVPQPRSATVTAEAHGLELGQTMYVSVPAGQPLLDEHVRASAQYADWKHSGSMYILTTPEGANLPASASVNEFPLLVRLHRDHFRFSEAEEGGSDIRFSAGGKPLSYEIEEWDEEAGAASIWVRIPSIRGNERQEIKIHWGNADSPSASDGKAVFNASNGYIGVWHLGSEVRDAVGRLESEDRGTTKAAGMISSARHFPGERGVFCGKDIQALPSGGAPHSTQAWFRAETSNGRIVAWGNEKAQGKVTMCYRSPPRIRMDCYFSNGNVRAEIPDRARGWTHAVHTFEDGQAIMYINGEKRGEGNPRHTQLAIERPSRMWIGGWYHHYDFVGDIDEVRISGVARSADWVRLEYENQKPLQTLVGPVVQDGDEFTLSPSGVEMNEGETVDLAARAGGAQKTYWSLVQGNEESVIASDRFNISFAAGRVSGDQKFKIRFDAVYVDGVRSIEVPVTVKETLPEPAFVLMAPTSWDGRETIEVRPRIRNLEAMQNAGVGELDYHWEVSGLATIKDEAPGKLVLGRAQNSGKMTVKLSLANGGDAVMASTDIAVQEPETDDWVPRVPGDIELPVEGQFYARDDSGKGTLHCKGLLEEKAGEVFLRVFAAEKKYAEEVVAPGKDGSYSFAIELEPALVKYRIELGTRTGGVEAILHRAGDIVCGDAYLIDGQSNALATDTREESPRVTNEWVRSYGQPRFFKEGERENLWCKPVWKAQREHLAELGWWGMELANRLVESQKVPIFIVNGARGGTRIDQHQRNDENPTDLDTIYGRMLWRVREARLTHGIRGIIWHQGENDQGAAGPDGGYGWETYQRYFIEMSADWKRDFPNVSRYYVFQIWPNACAMGGGNGDMLREKQRSLPRLYSNLEALSTLGVQPGGSCHYPLEGWSVFARWIQRLLERDFYGLEVDEPITAPNLIQAYYANVIRSSIALEFDQPVVWDDLLATQFYLDDAEGDVVGGEVTGNVLTLTLKESTASERITYLKEKSWKQNNILFGENGMAALTFCNVHIQASSPGNVASAAVKELPNIVIIYADDLGYGDLSCYNPEAAYKTPRLDRMAKEGIMFTDAHSPSTICSPSRYGLYSGQLVCRTGRGSRAFEGPGGPSYLEPGELTIADMVKKRGYRTGVFGKWHVGLTWLDKNGKQLGGGFKNSLLIDYDRSTPLIDGPNRRGFDESFITPNCPTTDPLYIYIQDGMVPSPASQRHRRENLPNPGGKWRWDNDEGWMAPDYRFVDADLLFYDKALEFITRHREIFPEKPFFAVLATQISHAPVLPAPEFNDKTKAGPRGDFVHELDVLTGRLLDAIDRLGIDDNTLVMFNSDNGPETVHTDWMRQDHDHDAAGGYRGMKRDGWEGGHRVPFIARWPGRIPAGKVSRQLTNTTDIFATIASIVGNELGDDVAVDSYDMLPAMLGMQKEEDSIRPHMLTQSFRGQFQVRQGEWKYLDHRGSGGNNYSKDFLQKYALPETAPEAPGQLFNLAVDPGETTNLFFTEPEKRQELQALLKVLTAEENGRSAPKNRKPMGIKPLAKPRPRGS